MKSLITCLLPFLLLFLSACQLQNTKPQSNRDLSEVMELQQQAQTAYDEGDWKTAISAYQELSTISPSDAEPWFRMGNAYARLQQPYDAIAAYREAIVRNPKNGKIWHNLGIVQLRQASATFVEMQQHLDENDPLAKRGRYVIDAMQEIMEKGFGQKDANASEN